MDGGPDETVDALRRGGLDVQLTAALIDHFLEVLGPTRRDEHLLAQPRDQGLSIGRVA
jgi:hypothetical protein